MYIYIITQISEWVGSRSKYFMRKKLAISKKRTRDAIYFETKNKERKFFDILIQYYNLIYRFLMLLNIISFLIF